MTNFAQIEKIITEVNKLDNNEKIILFNKMEEIIVNNQNDDASLESVFGLWKDRNVTKESLRKKAWENN
ncbi:MAG: hypothetical protein FWH12_09690 [Treponema sp.]|nr:hypothetical protein [Treponema sp.]